MMLRYNEKSTCFVTNIIIIACFLLLLLWSTIRLYSTNKRLRQTEYELGLIRTELESATNRESELGEQSERLRETVGNIRDITERTNTILSQSGNTIAEIRQEIQILEEYCASVSFYLNTNDNYTSNNSLQ